MNLNSSGCLLNEPADGLILSSFQILDQGDNEANTDAKERVLDHFLDSLSYEKENQLKDANSHWESDDRSSSSSSQLKAVSGPFPLDLDTLEDQDGPVLRDFTPQAVSHATHRAPGRADGGPHSDENSGEKSNGCEEDDEDEDCFEGEDEEEGSEIMHSLEQQSDMSMTRQDACDPLQLYNCSSQREETSQSKPLLQPPSTNYLNMQPVLSHSIYIDNTNDNSGLWHHDSTKDEFSSSVKPEHQQVCLSGGEWDPRKEITQKGDFSTTLENQQGSHNQTWDFLHGHEQAEHHDLLPAHHPMQSHWSSSAAKGAMSSVSIMHQQQQQEQARQQHQCQKHWMGGKNAWTHPHNHLDEANDKTLVSSSLHWPNQDQLLWRKDTGMNLPGSSNCGPMHNMYHMTPTSIPGSTVSPSPFPEMGHPVVSCAALSLPHQQLWNMESHLGSGGSNTVYHNQRAPPSMVHCSQPSTTRFLQASSVCQFQGQGMQPLECNNLSDGKKSRPMFNRRRAVSVNATPVSRCKSVLEQHRPNSHPYLPKDPKLFRDGFSNLGSGCNLKASHLVSWYIDYLIHENESLTQISRAFSLPVNLFHSDDFYFMDSVKKKTHFPSLKFLSWMRQKLPNININSVDFHEGRPPVASMWNQDWFWQNKSRRDIIHDVFFYFQHRRVAYPN